jgi:hypothetical protein
MGLNTSKLLIQLKLLTLMQSPSGGILLPSLTSTFVKTDDEAFEYSENIHSAHLQV